jgi:hypothetical protein
VFVECTGHVRWRQLFPIQCLTIHGYINR